jgi:hypothetical protein
VDEVALMAWTSGFGAGSCSPLPGAGYKYAYNIIAPSYPVSGSFDLSLPSGINLTFTGGSYYYYSNYTMVMVAPLLEKSLTAVLSVGPTLGVFTIASQVQVPMTLTTSETTTISIFSTLTLEASMETYEAWTIAGVMAIVVFAVLWIVVGRQIKRQS